MHRKFLYIGIVLVVSTIFALGDSSITTAEEQLDPNHVWVQFCFRGTEYGTEDNPFTTLAEGVATASNHATLYVKSGATTETLTIDKPLTLRAVDGIAVVGIDGVLRTQPYYDDYPDSLCLGPGYPQMVVVQTGEGTTSGFINQPGDIDIMQINLIGDVTYGLQSFYVPQLFVQPVDSHPVFTVLDSTGQTGRIQTTADLAWPSGVQQNTVDRRLVWTAPYSGAYYIRVQSSSAVGVGDYQFRLASSQVGVGVPREWVTNLRSYQLITGNSGNILYQGPTSVNRLDGQALSYLSGSISQQVLQVGGFFAPYEAHDGKLGGRLETYFDVTEPVYFFDETGEIKATPETPKSHLHLGTPSRDYADGEDDIVWNYDQFSIDFSVGPNHAAQPNKNLTLGSNPHNFVMDITDHDGILPSDVLHLILGHEWYIDAHFHDQFEYDPSPLVVSRPQGGISLFDSRFVLNGFETVPVTAAAEELEIFYNEEHQVFYIQYGVASPLAGEDIHIHAGGTGETGPRLIDLGTVPFMETRPVYEPEESPNNGDGTYEFVPGVENIIKRLSNAEAKALADATYTTGWYIDVHTSPFFEAEDTPLIRANAVLFDNLEVAAIRFE